MAQQLGRTPRGVVGVGARCVCGAPLVATTAPRLPDGTPFPTMYYLTHPGITAAISRLEAEGAMREMNDRLVTDADLAAAYQRAHEMYLTDRTALAAALQIPAVTEIEGISAGGMPNRVKCLHALAAHALAAGPGVNTFGDEVLTAIAYAPDKCGCE